MKIFWNIFKNAAKFYFIGAKITNILYKFV